MTWSDRLAKEALVVLVCLETLKITVVGHFGTKPTIIIAELFELIDSMSQASDQIQDKKKKKADVKERIGSGGGGGGWERVVQDTRGSARGICSLPVSLILRSSRIGWRLGVVEDQPVSTGDSHLDFRIDGRIAGKVK
jgi:hypothetical protein